MALTDDQKAMLRLLAQREEGYEDIAALMGLSVDEVRARVKEALAELSSGGSAQGSEGSAAGPVAAGDPPPPPVAKATSGAVPPAAPPAGEAEPAVEEPTVPAPISPASSERQTEAPKHRPRPSLSGLKLPKDRGALIGLGAGVVAVIGLVLILALSGGGDGDSSSAGSSDSTTGLTEEAASNDKLTQAILEPTDGGDASGRAIFGRLKNNVLLQVQAEGLEPTAEGQSYSVWLYRSPKLALRVGAVRADDSGKIAVQIPIPAEVLAYVAGGAFGQIDISLTDDATYKAELAKAKSQGRLPRYSGTSVLRGEIAGPAIKAANGS